MGFSFRKPVATRAITPYPHARQDREVYNNVHRRTSMDQHRDVQVKDNVILIAPPAGSRLPRSAYLTLAQQYAPEGRRVTMAEGGTGFLMFKGEQRLVHEFWMEG